MADTVPTEAAQAPRYDAFISYATQGDYTVARKVEAFCEGFHRSLGKGVNPPRALQLCRDGSDFRLPLRREGTASEDDALWEVIRPELERSRRLLVICSEEATQSPWVSREIAWMLAHHGPDAILLALTGRADPKTASELVFPKALRVLGLDQSRLWYDLRALRKVRGPLVRDADDELVRLANDLLDWDTAKDGALAALWMREQARRRRTLASVAVAVAALIAIAAVFASIEASRAGQQARLARGTATVTTAAAETDPAVAALLLTELDPEVLPAQAIQVATQVAAKRIPIAVLRGHVGRVQSLKIADDETRILTAAADGEVRVWPIRGDSDPVRLARHAPGETGAALLSDNRTVLSWGADGIANLIDMATKATRSLSFPSAIKQAVVLGTQNAEVVAQLSDERVAVGVPGGSVAILSLADPVMAMCQLPDAAALILTATGKALRLTAARAGGTLVPSLSLDPAGKRGPSSDALSRAVCSADGRQVAWLGADALVVQRDDGSKAVAIPISPSSNFGTVAFSPDGTTLIVGQRDGKIVRYDARTLAALRTFDPNIQVWSNAEMRGEDTSGVPDHISVTETAANADGSLIAAVYSDAPTRVWGLQPAPVARVLQNPFGQDHVALSRTGRYVATAADDGTIRVWDDQEALQPQQYRHSERLYSISLDSTGEWMAAGAADGSVGLWRRGDRAIHSSTPYAAVSAQCGAPDHSSDAQVMAVAFEANSRVLRAAYANGPAARWQIQASGSMRLLDVHCEGGKLSGGLAVATDATLLLARAQGAIDVWRPAAPPVRLAGTPAVKPTAWWARSANGPFVAGYEDGHVFLWNDAQAMPIEVGRPAHAKYVFCVCGSRDGRQLLTGSEDGTAKLWRVGATEPQAMVSDTEPGKWMETCAMLDERREALVASETGRMWRIRLDGKPAPEMYYDDRGLAHVGSISAIHWLPQRGLIVTAGGLDTAVRIWDAEQRLPVGVFQPGTGTVTALTFADDEQTAVVVGEDQTISTWPIDWHSISAALRSRTTATLNPTERERLLGESHAEAWKGYAASERAQRRTPLPEDFTFRIPF